MQGSGQMCVGLSVCCIFVYILRQAWWLALKNSLAFGPVTCGCPNQFEKIQITQVRQLKITFF